MKLLSISSLIAIGVCGCSSIVLEKAKLQNIHSLAIASLFAAERIPEVRGQGVLRKMDAEAKLQIAEDALAAFHQAFKTTGWEIVPADEMVQKESYRTGFAKPLNAPSLSGKASNAFAPRYFTPTEISPIWLGEDFNKSPPGRRLIKNDRESILDLMHELSIDTVALIRLQYCFRTFLRDRKERVVVTATSSLQLVGGGAQILYSQQKKNDCGGEQRGESQSSLALNTEDWMYDPLQREEIRALFEEASEAEARRAVASLPVSRRG